MFDREDGLQRFIMHIRDQFSVLHTVGIIISTSMGLNKSMCDLNKYMIIRFT